MKNQFNPNKKGAAVPQRIDKEFEQDLKEIAKIRLDKGLAKFSKEDLSYREMTRLLRRTQGYRISIDELKRLPKKENLK